MNYENKVQVGETALNVYTEGNGDFTIVFMAGNGVTCPVLEYKPIYRRMSDKYRIAVIEKAGYGFSDSAKTPRTIENLVNEDREALHNAGIEPPYVLAPHSYSGFEAVYWANTYRDEVKAVLSMDMGIPAMAVLQAREVSEENRCGMVKKHQKLLQKVAKGGLITKLLKNKLENVSGLLSSNELTDEEKKIYREMFYKNISNQEFTDEALLMTDNAQKAENTGILKCPCCFYISDMKTLSKKVSWRKTGMDYAEKCGGEVHLSDKGHMMYAFIPDEMSETFSKFLNHNFAEQNYDLSR